MEFCYFNPVGEKGKVLRKKGNLSNSSPLTEDPHEDCRISWKEEDRQSPLTPERKEGGMGDRRKVLKKIGD